MTARACPAPRNGRRRPLIARAPDSPCSPRLVVAVWAGAVLCLAACSPALDWREVRPDGSGAVLLMPCKPKSQERRLALDGQRTLLTLYACSASDQTWSLAFADVGDPARVSGALQALVRAAGDNVAASSQQALALKVPGATPNGANQRMVYQGQLPDGKVVQMQVAVFAHGTRVFQVTAVGGALPAEGLDTFMGSIRIAN